MRRTQDTSQILVKDDGCSESKGRKTEIPQLGTEKARPSWAKELSGCNKGRECSVVSSDIGYCRKDNRDTMVTGGRSWVREMRSDSKCLTCKFKNYLTNKRGSMIDGGKPRTKIGLLSICIIIFT